MCTFGNTLFKCFPEEPSVESGDSHAVTFGVASRAVFLSFSLFGKSKCSV